MTIQENDIPERMVSEDEGGIFDIGSLFDELKTSIVSDNWPTAVGDIVHRDSSYSSAFIGHAGIAIQTIDHQTGVPLPTPVIAHVFDRDSENGKALVIGAFGQQNSAVRSTYMSGPGEYWGAKRAWSKLSGPSMTLTVEEELEFYSSLMAYKNDGVEYDFLHLNPKGKQLSNGHWEMDCVGFTERLLEDIGRDPTPEGDEKGLGWPFTPREQRDSARMVIADPVH